MARNPNIWSREVPLLSAEAKVILSASKGGEKGRVLIEVFPYPHSGNAPGILLRYMLDWRRATQFAVALKRVAEDIGNGVDVVPGTRYAPVMFFLGQGGEFDDGMRLVLTQDDCETLMHFVIEAAAFATKQPGLIVAHTSR